MTREVQHATGCQRQDCAGGDHDRVQRPSTRDRHVDDLSWRIARRLAVNACPVHEEGGTQRSRPRCRQCARCSTPPSCDDSSRLAEPMLCHAHSPQFLDASQGRKTRGQRHRHCPESTCGELPTPGVKPVSSNQKCFATTTDPSVAKMIVQPIACQNARAEDARSLVVPACFQQLTPIAAR